MELNQEIISKNISPIISGGQVLFIYEGTATTVYLTGDYNRWELEDSMSYSGGSNVWYIEKNFPVNARFDYKFVVDGNWITDPLNANTSVVGANINSTLIMPEYKSAYETIIGSKTPQGILIKDRKLRSAYLNTEMNYHVYVPPGYKTDNAHHILYALDGSDYVNYASINRVLDYMTANKDIPETVAVLIDTADRSRDLTLYRPYYNYIINELMPAAENEYVSGNIKRYAAGVSWGGLTAFYLAMSTRYPFSGVLSQSGSYWPKDWKIFDIVAKALTPPITFVVQTGTIEDTEEMNDAMVRLLAEKGYELDYEKYAETHSWYNWRGHLYEGLKKLFSNE